MNNTLTIKHPDPAKVNATFLPVLSEARSIVIADKASADRAGELMRAIKGAERFLLEGDSASGWEGFAAPVKAANDGHKFLVKLRDMALEPYTKAAGDLNSRLLTYEAEERRKAEEAARVAQEAARKAEEERKIREAMEAEAAGNPAEAAAILDEPVTVPTYTAPAAPRIEGRSVAEQFSAECFDVVELAKHVIAHPEDANLLLANGPAINQRARSQKKGFKLPGCRLVVKEVARTRVG